jgi:UPF0755 protein
MARMDRQPKTKRSKVGLRILVSALTIIIACASALTFVAFWPIFPNSKEKVDFKIRWGTPLNKIISDLAQRGIISNPATFKQTLKIFGKKSSLRAGKFALLKGSSNYQVIKALVSGPQSYLKVTIPEGITADKIAGICASALELDSLRFISLLHDSAVVRRLGIKAPSLEGYLYPETYNFTYGINEEQVLHSLVHQFKAMVSDSLEKRSLEMGYSLSEMITLASIIEGEAMLDSEMALISSVYHNRLRLRMLLQADPTIQYILPGGARRLLRRDLEINSPYNTYLYPGLPPGPIGNPGIKAIRAALFPAASNYLYFVANGDGSHTFSASLHQHLLAKGKFDQIRRQVAREKREKRLRGQNQ